MAKAKVAKAQPARTIADNTAGRGGWHGGQDSRHSEQGRLHCGRSGIGGRSGRRNRPCTVVKGAKTKSRVCTTFLQPYFLVYKNPLFLRAQAKKQITPEKCCP